MPLDIPSASTTTQVLTAPGGGRLRLPPISDLLAMSNAGRRNFPASRSNSPSRFNARPDGFIDLTTEDPSSPPQLPSILDSPISESEFIALLENESLPPQRSFDSDIMPARGSRNSTVEQPARKRRRLGSEASTRSKATLPNQSNRRHTALQNHVSIDSDEVLDLTEVDGTEALKRVQDQQREKHVALQEQQNQLVKDSVQAQEPENKGPFKLGQVQCVICMDSMTDMTATHCGHLFCHTCIMEALIAGENQGENGKGLPRCPSCRTKVVRNPAKGQAQIIPLALKFTTKSEKARGKEKATS